MMFRDAEERGVLKPGAQLLEATSGNTGIAMAMIAVLRGYRFRAVMAESASIERRKVMKMFGTDIVLTDAAGGTNLAIKTAQQMLSEDPSWVNLNQFENSANPRSHEETTGPEILRDVPDVTHVVAGMGTGGTLTGLSAFMHRQTPQVKVVGVEPIAGSKIQGLRNMAAYTPGIFSFDNLDVTLRHLLRCGPLGSHGTGPHAGQWRDCRYLPRPGRSLRQHGAFRVVFLLTNKKSLRLLRRPSLFLGRRLV
jgi:cysteine synthase